MQGIITIDDLYFKSRRRKMYNFGKYSLHIAFLRDIHEEYVWLKDADYEQSKFANEFKNIDKGPKSVEKNLFLSEMRLLLTAREKVPNNFKNRLFLINTPAP